MQAFRLGKRRRLVTRCWIFWRKRQALGGEDWFIEEAAGRVGMLLQEKADCWKRWQAPEGGGGGNSWTRMYAPDVGLLNWLASHLILKMLSGDA